MSQYKRNKRIADMVDKAMKNTKNQHDRWKRSSDLYKGKTDKFRNSVDDSTVNKIEINVTKPVIDTMCPHLFFRAPQLRVSPSKVFVDEGTKNTVSKISDHINAVVEEIKTGKEYKKATKDALLFGIGIIKTGVSEPDSIDDDDDYGFLTPYTRRWSPFDFGVDPMCREVDLSDSGYIVFKITENIKNFIKDKSLIKPGRLKPDSVADIKDGRESDDETKVESIEYASLYEVWDRETRKVILSDKEGNIYKKVPWPQRMYPASIIAFNTVPEEFYCMGEPEYLEVYQIEMSEKRTQWLNHTRRFNRKYKVPPSMSKDDQKSLKFGGDGTVVVSKDDVQVIQDAPMSGDVVKEIDMIKGEIQEISGVDAYKKSQGAKGVYTATEAQMIGSASDIQVGERKNVIAEAFAHTGRVLYELLKEQNGWPDLDFNFEVEMSSMSRPDDSQKRQDLIALAQNAGQYPQFKVENFLKDLAISLGKNPESYLKTPEDLQKEQANQPPAPEQIKAQMEQQKAQMDMQIAQQKAQMDMQMKQMDAQMKQMEAQSKAMVNQKETESKLQIIDATMQLEQMKVQMEQIRLQFDMKKMQMDSEKMERDAKIEKETKKNAAV